uniref:Potassium two pore domain channel subfamily K member 4 n=1 Tax=Hippocampus comes TaxID=109280 RepID=A0A3Q2YFI1_HIPCM
MRCTTVLALLFGVVLYLGMGALVFQNLEASEEYDKFQELLAAKNNFLNNHFCVSEPEFSELVKGVASAVEAGLEVDSLSTNFTTRWDVASAFFFCGAIITTIGFGNLSPRTWYGQLFCVCYALVGIPMFGILLAGVGDHMGTVLRRAVAKIETLFLKRQVRPTTVRVISAVLSILIGCLIFLAVPTVFFQKSEGWSFLESLYFVVITLTTVGFGDYVPAKKVPRDKIGIDGSQAGGLFFKPLVWLWIVFGLAYFASILTMIGNWLRVLSKRTRAEARHICAHAHVLRAHRTVEAEGDKMNPEEEARCGENKASPDLSSLPPSPSLPPYSTGLLDFFGENLAYIDESSDALSERADEKRRRPHKPKRKSVKNVRRLSKHEWSSKQARRPGEDLQPPSNPPTPPPDSLLSSSLTYRDSPQTL